MTILQPTKQKACLWERPGLSGVMSVTDPAQRQAFFFGGHVEYELREQFAIIKEVTGIDLSELIISVDDWVNGILVTWVSFDSMKYVEIVDYCIGKITTLHVNHTFEP